MDVISLFKTNTTTETHHHIEPDSKYIEENIKKIASDKLNEFENVLFGGDKEDWVEDVASSLTGERKKVFLKETKGTTESNTTDPLFAKIKQG